MDKRECKKAECPPETTRELLSVIEDKLAVSNPEAGAVAGELIECGREPSHV